MRAVMSASDEPDPALDSCLKWAGDMVQPDAPPRRLAAPTARDAAPPLLCPPLSPAPSRPTAA